MRTRHVRQPQERLLDAPCSNPAHLGRLLYLWRAATRRGWGGGTLYNFGIGTRQQSDTGVLRKPDSSVHNTLNLKESRISLSISNIETSVVYSINIKDKKFTNDDIIDLINKNNPKYKINKIAKLNTFKLSSSNLRNYSHKNILAFGDILHRVHPLAGQGFNMTIRDLGILSQIIDDKIELGIQLDSLILDEFENKTKDKNFVFSNAIDLIYEIFNFDKNIKNKNFSKILKIIGKNKSFNNFIVKLADAGFNT